MKTELTIAGIPVYVEGDGPEVLIMVHGWPDTHRIWDRQVAFFRQNYRCVTFSLPGFGEPGPVRGYTLAEVVDTLRRIADAVSPDRKVNLMIHDWGCVFGYQYALSNPERVARLIAIEIGDSGSPDFEQSLSLTAKSMVVTYQMTLAAAWYLGGFAGDAITRGVARGLQGKAESRHVHSGMNYPYAMRWMGAHGGLADLLPVEPPFPFFYVYGRKKPFMFHSASWLSRMGQRAGNAVREYNCGHWVMVDAAEGFNREVAAWLAEG